MPHRSFPEHPGIHITDKLFLSVLQCALQQLHGVVGGAVPIDLLGCPAAAPGQGVHGPGALGVRMQQQQRTGGKVAAGRNNEPEGAATTNMIVKISKRCVEEDAIYPIVVVGRTRCYPRPPADVHRTCAYNGAPALIYATRPSSLFFVAPCSDLNKLWNACTCMTTYDDHVCRLQVRCVILRCNV